MGRHAKTLEENGILAGDLGKVTWKDLVKLGIARAMAKKSAS